MMTISFATGTEETQIANTSITMVWKTVLAKNESDDLEKTASGRRNL